MKRFEVLLHTEDKYQYHYHKFDVVGRNEESAVKKARASLKRFFGISDATVLRVVQK